MSSHGPCSYLQPILILVFQETGHMQLITACILKSKNKQTNKLTSYQLFSPNKIQISNHFLKCKALPLQMNQEITVIYFQVMSALI